ncbi:MAG: hypothetical protein CYPHOPRED_005553 [Cyphobasidiales sp. Tagirdzhanova-0007]|nr:MAG: hypothetical protein CYPHOPRED_005553 [Cyphobasidiales sp. Tagirdzhanova-0007]
MKACAVAAVLAAVAKTAYAQSSLPLINTPPSLVECQPAAITFSGGQAPYIISVLPAGQVAAVPLEFLPSQPSAGTYTWQVNLAAGLNISLSIRDGTGALNYAAPLVIQPGTSSSCLNTTAGAAASSAGATAAVGTSATATAGGVSSIATTSAPITSGTLIQTVSSQTVTAATGTPSNINPVNSSTSAYPSTCPQGMPNYAITSAILPNVTLDRATSFFHNWTSIAPGVLINSTGYGLGATRSYSLTSSNITFTETLRLNSTNSITMELHQQWNTSEPGPVTVGDLTLYSAFHDLTVYTNTTIGATELQYFIFSCGSDQAEGIAAVAAFLEQEIAFYVTQLTGTSNTTSSSPTRRHLKLY